MPINVITIQEIDKYIRTASGGSHKVFAKKLGVSPSTLSRHIRFMRDKGAPICFDYTRRTHYYERTGWFNIGFRDGKQQEDAA